MPIIQHETDKRRNKRRGVYIIKELSTFKDLCVVESSKYWIGGSETELDLTVQGKSVKFKHLNRFVLAIYDYEKAGYPVVGEAFATFSSRIEYLYWMMRLRQSNLLSKYV